MDELLPIIIDMLQDSSALQKREVQCNLRLRSFIILDCAGERSSPKRDIKSHV